MFLATDISADVLGDRIVVLVLSDESRFVKFCVASSVTVGLMLPIYVTFSF